MLVFTNKDKKVNVCQKNVTNIMNVTINKDAAKPLEDLCIDSRIYYDLPKRNNLNFQKKSWDTGCKKKKRNIK